MRYTENLLKKGEERRRLTKQLAELVGKIADEIADTVEPDKFVQVGEYTFYAHKFHSNIGTETFLCVETEESGRRVITNRDPGSEFALHGDLRVIIQVASKEDFLFFANNLFEIIEKFEASEEAIIHALREAFEKLRRMAEA